METVAVIVIAILSLAFPIVALRSPIADTPQVVRYTTPPLYSDKGRQEGIEGAVRIEARIDGDGRPRDLRVIRGLGFGLDENALLAVRNWRFTPGSRADAIAQVEVEFDLRNAELNELIANDMVTSVGPNVVPPRIVHRVEPLYPAAAPQQERKRAVWLDAVIQDDGTPQVLRVVRSLSWEADEAAIAALEQWRFSPAEKDGAPVKVRMTFEMGFSSPTN